MTHQKIYIDHDLPLATLLAQRIAETRPPHVPPSNCKAPHDILERPFSIGFGMRSCQNLVKIYTEDIPSGIVALNAARVALPDKNVRKIYTRGCSDHYLNIRLKEDEVRNTPQLFALFQEKAHRTIIVTGTTPFNQFTKPDYSQLGETTYASRVVDKYLVLEAWAKAGYPLEWDLSEKETVQSCTE